MLFVADGNWSAFDHTLTSLESGVLNDSFLGLVAWNSAKGVAKQESRLTSVSNVQRCSAYAGMLEQVSASLANDTNSGGSTSFQTSTYPAVTMISDENISAGVKPRPAVTSADSRLTTSNSFDTVSVTSTEARMLMDVNCQIVDSRQVIIGRNAEDVKRLSQTKDRFTVNRPVRGKENIQPSELTKLNSRKHVNSERHPVELRSTGVTAGSIASKHGTQRTGSQESGAMNQWASPLRRSVNNAENACLDQSQSFSRRSRKEHKAADMSESFSALSVAADDYADSYANQHSPNKFSEYGLHSDADEVYKRSSSTPVKDQSLREPVRFRRQQHSGGSLEADEGQRQSSLQHFGEASASASEIIESQNEHSRQRAVKQSDDQSVEMNAVHTERLSCGPLSTGSLPDDSLIAGNSTFESTVLLSLPANVYAESVQDDSCSEVGTQTSFLLPSDKRKTSIPSTSGNCELCCFNTDLFCLALMSSME